MSVECRAGVRLLCLRACAGPARSQGVAQRYLGLARCGYGGVDWIHGADVLLI